MIDGVINNNDNEKLITIERFILLLVSLSIALNSIQFFIVRPNRGCSIIHKLSLGLDFENAQTAKIKKHVVGISGKNKPITPNMVAKTPIIKKIYLTIFECTFYSPMLNKTIGITAR
jgi:hypothetical protein